MTDGKPRVEDHEECRWLLDIIPDIVYRIDADGKIVFINPAVRKLGYEPEDLIGREFKTLIHPDDRAAVCRETVLPGMKGRVTGDTTAPKLVDERRTGDRMTRDLEIRLVRKSGEKQTNGAEFAHGEIVSFGDYAGEKFLGSIGVIRDVTGRRRVMDQLIQSEKMRALGDMLAGMAHEINNPLTSILGYVQLLLNRQDLTAEAREDIASIQEEARRTAKIVEGVTSMARRRGAKREPCSLNEIIADSVKINTHRLTQNEIRLDLSLDRNIGRTMADAGQIQQVVMNLINNAIQALQKSADRTLRITSRLDGETVHITVQDNGPGIAPEHLSRIFEPFFTTKDPAQGVGLGLSVSHTILAGHGGGIRAESRPGEGAMFFVDLPLIEPPPIYSYEPDKPGAKSGGGIKTVVVVEDVGTNREIFRRFLEGREYRVETFSCVDDAIAALETMRVAVVVSDFKLPGKDARDLYAHLKARHPDLAKKFILISGDVLSEEVAQFIEETHVAVLEKPFDLSKLADRIEDFIS